MLLRGQVRLVLNRNADLRMIGGRNEMDAEYDVGFDDDGRCARHMADLTLPLLHHLLALTQ